MTNKPTADDMDRYYRNITRIAEALESISAQLLLIDTRIALALKLPPDPDIETQLLASITKVKSHEKKD